MLRFACLRSTSLPTHVRAGGIFDPGQMHCKCIVGMAKGSTACGRSFAQGSAPPRSVLLKPEEKLCGGNQRAASIKRRRAEGLPQERLAFGSDFVIRNDQRDRTVRCLDNADHTSSPGKAHRSTATPDAFRRTRFLAIQLEIDEPTEPDDCQRDSQELECTDVEPAVGVGVRIRFEIDLYAHEEDKQSIETDAEETEQRDEGISDADLGLCSRLLLRQSCEGGRTAEDGARKLGWGR